MRRVPLGLASLRVVPAGLAACLVAVGCGSATAPQAGSAPAATGTATTGTATTGTGGSSGCQVRAPAAGALTITLAGNGKTYCVRVGGTLRVYLRGTPSSTWLRPAASSAALVPAPDPAGMLARGVTGASFTAARPGKVLVTSVRPPCNLKFPMGKGDLQPSDTAPTTYPLRLCPVGQRFSASIIVQR